jgi:Protein of unknown function (DUF4056)
MLNFSREYNFESPFLTEEILAGENEARLEARSTGREPNSPFCKVAVLGGRCSYPGGDMGSLATIAETSAARGGRNRAEPSGEEEQEDFAEEARYGDEFDELEEEGPAFDGAPELSPVIAEALQSRDWPGALRLAIGAGWRDEGKLTNLVFFASRPELSGRALDPKHPKFAEHSREWVATRDVIVRKAIQEFAQNAALVVSGKEVVGYDRHFRSRDGQRFKLLIKAAAKYVHLNPSLLAATLLAETGSRNSYLTSSKVKSYHIGVDDFYDRRAALGARVPAYSRIQWDRRQKPEEHYNDAKKPRLVRTISFDSGPAALLASAVYLKYGEVRLQEEAAKLSGDFDALPLETRWALIRMAFNAGMGGAQKRLARALKGEDILVRKDVKVKAYQTDRNATVRTAQAIHLSEWIFGSPLNSAVVQPESESVSADDGSADIELTGESGESRADFWTEEVEADSLEGGEDVGADQNFIGRLEETQLAPDLKRGMLPNPPRTDRGCCALGKHSNALDPVKAYVHSYDPRVKEELGYVYSCRGGFIDFGHVREWADWTGYLAASARNLLNAGAVLDLGRESAQLGGRRLELLAQGYQRSNQVCVRVAQRIAFELAVWHEIASYVDPPVLLYTAPFGRPFGTRVWATLYSTFSPEDNYSNLLGTYIAAMALLKHQGSEFDVAVGNAIKQWLKRLGAVSKDKTEKALAAVKDKWWKDTTDVDPLLVRHFTATGRVEPLL